MSLSITLLLLLFLIYGLGTLQWKSFLIKGHSFQPNNDKKTSKFEASIQKTFISRMEKQFSTLLPKKSLGSKHNWKNREDTSFKSEIITNVGKLRGKRAIDDPCARYGTCDFVATLPTERKYCHCDNQCARYNDCCPDKQKSLTNSKSTAIAAKCLQHVRSKEQKFGTAVITSCLRSFEGSKTDYRCGDENIESYAAWVSDKNGNVYMNRFCALCNDISDFDFYSVKVHNVENIDITTELNKTQLQKLDLINTPRVILEFVPPAGLIPRTCIIEDYQDTSSDLCLKYGVNPIFKNNWLYRNYFCTEESTTATECFVDKDPSDTFYSLFPMTVLFQFSDRSRDSGCSEVRTDVCFGEEIYRNYQVRAYFSAVIYNEGFVPINLLKMASVRLSSSLQIVGFSSIFAIRAQVFAINETQVLVVNATIALLNDLYRAGVLKYTNLLRSVSRTLNIIDERSMESFAIEFQKADERFEKRKGLVIFEWQQSKDFNDDVSIVSVNDRGIFNSQNTICTNLSVNVISQENFTTSFVASLQCLSDVSFKMNGPYNLAKVVMSYSGFALSVISLSVFIIVHRRLGKHTTIGGANLENVCIALLTATTLFLFGIGLNDYPIICKVMAVLLHFSWLTVFSFMSIAVIFIIVRIRKFETNATNSKDETKWTKIGIRAKGIGIPVLFVIPPLILSSYDVMPFYGGIQPHVCFPTGFPINLMFVSGPILFSIILNVVCLTLMICHIRKNAIMSARLTKSKSFNEVGIYLRFSILSGTPWILGLLATLLDVDVVDFVFILLCSLQGVFLVIANITTRNIRSRPALEIRIPKRNDDGEENKGQVDKF